MQCIFLSYIIQIKLKKKAMNIVKKNEKKTIATSNRKKIKRAQKMHVTRIKKTRNLKGSNHIKGCDIKKSF
jgi:hypothetical protein